MRRFATAAMTALFIAGILPLPALADTQTITWDTTAPASATVGGPTYTPAATATSGLPVSITIDASSGTACTIDGGGVVSFAHVGTCTIDADQAGDGTFSPAPQVQQSITVDQGSQTVTITSTAPVSPVVGDTYTVTASATSGLTPVLSIDGSATAVCSISGSLVTFDHPGTCVIDANQAGNADWAAATQDQQSIVVGKAPQTITFTSTPSSPVVGGTSYTVTATGGGSGNAITFTIDGATTSVCSISGSSVSFQHTGTCTIDANQAGSADYLAASQKKQSFVVGKGSQTVTFTSTAPSSAVVGDPPYHVAATGGATGNPVTFAIDAASSAVCSITGGNSVHINHVGTCTIDASQAGSADYNAGSAQQSFIVVKANQTITFTSTKPSTAVVGGAGYTPTATATSGLTVTFTVDPSSSGVCSITGSSVSFQHVGTCVVDADQAGNGDWNAAPQAQQSFAVGKGSQTLAFTTAAPAATVGGATYTPAATSSAGLAVALAVDAGSSGVCTMAAGVVSFQHAGTCTIDANQAGSADYLAAPQVQQAVTVTAAGQTIAFTSTPPANAKVGGPAYHVTATGGASGNPVVFSIDALSAGACTISGSDVTFVHAGSCVVDANQAGTTDYLAAPQQQQTLPVGKGDQTVSVTSTAPSAAKVAGATYDVAASASSGLTATFSIDASSAGACTISGATVGFVHTGTCVVDANQAGNADWNAAPQVQQSFTVGKGDQTITYTSANPSPVNLFDHYTPTATSTSGGTVSFSIAPSSAGICSIDGANQITFSALGAPGCIVDADQAGGADYNAAPTLTMTIGVDDRPPVCTPATPLAVVMNKAISGAANCTDADLQTLTYSIGVNGTKGTAVIDASTGAWTYTPHANATGSDTFTIEANDSIVSSDPATISVTITSYFDPRNDGVTVVAAVPSSIDVLVNDDQGMGQPLTITAVTQGTLGKVTTDGKFVTYDPTSCALGTDVFSYSVTDGVATPVQKSVFVTIGRPGTSDGRGGTLSPTPVTNAPTVTFLSGTTIGSTTPVRLGWCGVVAPTTSLSAYRVLQSANGGTSWTSTLISSTTGTSKTFSVSSSYRYVWGARTVDKASRLSPYASSFVSRILRTESTSTSIVYKGTWSVARSSSYSGGSERYAKSTSALATYKTATTARMFAIVASRASARGSFRVYVDGVLVATVTDRASSTQYRRVLYVRSLAPGVSHTIVVRPAGNGRIDLDAILTIQ